MSVATIKECICIFEKPKAENHKVPFSCASSNFVFVVAKAGGGEDTSQMPKLTLQATTSSRGFTSTHNSSFPKEKTKQKSLKNNKNLKTAGKVAKTPKGKIKLGANKNKSNDKADKQNVENDEKPPLPEVTVVRSFNTAETEMSPSVHSPKKYVLFVGNLPYSVTKEQIEDHFRKTGECILCLVSLF